MKNSWLISIFVVGVIITVFVAFNYQGGRETVSLNEIFPDEGDYDIEIEYEFVDKADQQVRQVDTIIVEDHVEKVIEETPQVVTMEKAKVVTLEPAVKKQAAYTIQVSSHKSKAKAQQMVDKLKTQKIDAYSQMRNLGDKGIWYRVYVGHFSTKQEAKKKLPSITKYYPSSFIIAPKK